MKSPQLPRPTHIIIIVVSHKQKTIVRSDRNPVRTIHFMSDNASHLTAGINPIHPLNSTPRIVQQLHAVTTAILRIREIQPIT